MTTRKQDSNPKPGKTTRRPADTIKEWCGAHQWIEDAASKITPKPYLN